MNILQVKYVLEIAKYQNISRAADALYVSQPALSLQIKKLEEELGFALFVRTPHGVRLSQNGEIFREKATAVMSAWQDLEQSMKQRQVHPGQQKLRIWIGARVYANDLFESIVDFFDRYHTIEPSFISSMGSIINVYDALSNGEIDIAIDRLPPKYMASDINQYYIQVLLQERTHVLLRKTHPLAAKASLTAQDLQDYESVSFEEGSCIDNMQKAVFERLGLTYGRKHVSASISESMDLIRRGTCFAIGTKAVAEANQLATIPFSPSDFIPLEFSCLKERISDPSIRLFSHYVTKLCSEKEENSR